MNLPLLFARRYLLASRSTAGRSTNAINVITFISIVVIAVVSAAMVVVLSAVNGISELVDTIYSPFDQDITITPAEGKTLHRDSLDVQHLLAVSEAPLGSWTIEENVLLMHDGQQSVATLKGVEEPYLRMSDMQRYLFSGEARLHSATGSAAVLGIGLRSDLGVPLDDGVLRPLTISAPIRGRKLSTYQQRAFERMDMAVAGTFTMNMEFDMRYVLVPFAAAETLFHYSGEASALELKLPAGRDADAVADALRNELGPEYLVRTRRQKNVLMYQTNASEKFFSFLVLAFIGLIGAFNIIASLTMMMIEKRKDMGTLHSLGADTPLIRRVFLYEGLLIVLIGELLGITIGLGVCWVQERFGLVPLDASVVDHYPVKVLWSDLVLVFATVGAIGLLATWVPLRALSKRFLHTTSVA
jgi:ABC-type lipoprotein release transport system permease subunit